MLQSNRPGWLGGSVMEAGACRPCGWMLGVRWCTSGSLVSISEGDSAGRQLGIQEGRLQIRARPVCCCGLRVTGWDVPPCCKERTCLTRQGRERKRPSCGAGRSGLEERKRWQGWARRSRDARHARVAPTPAHRGLSQPSVRVVENLCVPSRLLIGPGIAVCAHQ